MPGSKRWGTLTTRFVEGMLSDAEETALQEPHAASSILHNEENIPTLPPAVFWAEVLRWSTQACNRGAKCLLSIIDLFCPSLAGHPAACVAWRMSDSTFAKQF